MLAAQLRRCSQGCFAPGEPVATATNADNTGIEAHVSLHLSNPRRCGLPSLARSPPDQHSRHQGPRSYLTPSATAVFDSRASSASLAEPTPAATSGPRSAV